MVSLDIFRTLALQFQSTWIEIQDFLEPKNENIKF